MHKSPEIRSVLKKYWGHTGFRSQQEEIIRAVLDKKDVLALLPTGGGKSICYQIPGIIIDGLTVVVSPLISLMEDQVANLKKRGISAAALHSGVYTKVANLILDNCINGKIKILYLAPERLISTSFRNTLIHLPIKLLAIDEAHCISQWGHDFRTLLLANRNHKRDFSRFTDFSIDRNSNSKSH